jgi:hypothetical protein
LNLGDETEDIVVLRSRLSLHYGAKRGISAESESIPVIRASQPPFRSLRLLLES